MDDQKQSDLSASDNPTDPVDPSPAPNTQEPGPQGLDPEATKTIPMVEPAQLTPPPVEPVQPTPPVYQPPQPVVSTPPQPSVNAVVTTPGESAGEFQNRVIQSEQVKEVKQARRTYKLENAVNVLFGSIEASLAIRLAFKLLGARTTSGFVDFLYDFTSVFAGPFEGIFGTNPSFGSFELDLGAIIGMIIYGAVGFGVVKLVKLF